MMNHVRVAAFVAAGSLAMAACGSGGYHTSSASSGTTAVASAAPAASPATTATASPAIVQVADNAKEGKILVGANGHTLYLLEKEQGTTSSCTGTCAANWPAVTASGTPVVGPGVDSSKVSTANGQVPNQVVYNGHLLYLFVRDAAPGDVNGLAVSGWYPVGPDGNKVDKS